MTNDEERLEQKVAEGYRNQDAYIEHTNFLRTIANSVIINGNYAHIKKKRASDPSKHAIHILARPSPIKQDLETGLVSSLEELKRQKKEQEITVGRYAIMLNLRGTIFNEGLQLFYEDPVLVRINHEYSPLFNELYPAVCKINEYSENNICLTHENPKEYFETILGMIDNHIGEVKKNKPHEFRKPKKGIIPYARGEHGKRIFLGYHEPHHFDDIPTLK